MVTLTEFVITYTIGAIGALIMVYLRWTGALPRFKGALEIESLEDEYKEVKEHISGRFQRGQPGQALAQPEVEHLNHLRDDIWRQRSTSFLGWAAMYVVLGGAVASLFLGEFIQDIGQVDKVVKVAAAGLFWTSFLSLLDTKSTLDAVEKLRGESSEKAEGLIQKLTETVSGLKTENEKAQDAIKGLVNQYNELADDYNSLLGNS